jgi:KilA-N domain/P63C domain
MSTIIVHQFGSVWVGIEKKNGYLNATKLCAAYNDAHGTNKIPRDWLVTQKAKEYIAYVSTVRAITQTLLIVVKQGGAPDEQGTWIHPDLADDFASWLCVEYKFRVSQLLQSWRSGKVEFERISAMYVLPAARGWDERFNIEFYDQLERLTNLHPKGHTRPAYWGSLTKEFVYDYLPLEIAEGVRNARETDGGLKKLHQFLTPEGLDLLGNHLAALRFLMGAAGTIEDLRQMAIRRFKNQYQLAMKLK